MIREATQSALQRLARTRVSSLHRSLPAFQVCGYTGVGVAIALAMILTGKTGLSYWVMSAIVAAAMTSFLALGLLMKIVTGEEQIIYYHQEIGVMVVAAFVVNLLRQPVLPYLDITILGIGAFLACGRVGCLMVGCCHGRPFPWGIRYREEHAREGFAPYLVGITLFPIQAAESLWVLFVVVRGVALIWGGQPQGSMLAWYTVGYGAARFSFEFIRGDVERPYTWGFSQAQWLSLWLMGGVVWAEWSQQIPFHAWHSITLAGLLTVMLAVTAQRRLDQSQRFRILHPHHVREVAAVMGRATEPVTPRSRPGRKFLSVRVACTSMGIQISCGRVEDPREPADHYTLSHCNRPMSQAAAMLLAELIRGLRRETRPSQLLPGNGAYHLILPRDRQNGAVI
ncbi:MAG: prolipoprotein diacylglyceryl transferase family protein [Candidatus Angelobacter sp.]